MEEEILNEDVEDDEELRTPQDKAIKMIKQNTSLRKLITEFDLKLI